MANMNVNITPSFPGEALLVAILQLISTQQQIVLTAPEKYRDAYFERLGKMEDFWFRPLELLGKQLIKFLEHLEQLKKD